MKEQEFQVTVTVYMDDEGSFLAETNTGSSGHNSTAWEDRDAVIDTARDLLADVLDGLLP